jgi:hypothetical protein
MQTSPLVHCMYTNCHTMACWLPRHVSPMYVRVRTHNTSLGASALPWLRNLVQSIGIWSLSVTSSDVRWKLINTTTVCASRSLTLISSWQCSASATTPRLYPSASCSSS